MNNVNFFAESIGYKNAPNMIGVLFRSFLAAATAITATADVTTVSYSSAISTSHLCSSRYHVTAKYSFCRQQVLATKIRCMASGDKKSTATNYYCRLRLWRQCGQAIKCCPV